MPSLHHPLIPARARPSFSHKGRRDIHGDERS